MMNSTGNWIVRLSWGNEIAWNQTSSLKLYKFCELSQWNSKNTPYLMNKLIKCMLTVCARLTPNNRSRTVADTFTSLGNRFSVTFHITLLEIRSKSMHILIVWKHCRRFGAVKVRIPNSQQSQNDGCILVQWGCLEMLIHVIGTV